MSDASSSLSDVFPPVAFIGGGNMARAIVGGLRQRGLPAGQITVVEPQAEAAEALRAQFGVTVLPAASAALAGAGLMVWAVKPQVFAEAAAPVRPHAGGALHLSVAAGIGTDSLARWLGTPRVVRAMPNTPALVGRGMTGLFARAEVGDADRALAERLVATTGEHLWVDAEAQLDAVTALSGSGPAYVFYFLEAMQQAGTQMGLTPAQALQLAVATFSGASALAAQGMRAGEGPATLRERVTSKGGTTFAALTAMDAAGMKPAFIAAMQAAHARAQALGREFGHAEHGQTQHA